MSTKIITKEKIDEILEFDYYLESMYNYDYSIPKPKIEICGQKYYNTKEFINFLTFCNSIKLMELDEIKKNRINTIGIQDIINPKSGIYFLFNDDDEIMYIGKSYFIISRLCQHSSSKLKSNHKFGVACVHYMPECDLGTYEFLYISKYKCIKNMKGKTCKKHKIILLIIQKINTYESIIHDIKKNSEEYECVFKNAINNVKQNVK